MIHRPDRLGALEFAVVSALRAAQLMRGCTPRLPGGEKPVTMAQREVAEGKVAREIDLIPAVDSAGDEMLPALSDRLREAVDGEAL